jgi:hypothetical protein
VNYEEIKKSSNRLSLQHFFLVIDFNYKIWVYRGKSSGVPVTQPAGCGGKTLDFKRFTNEAETLHLFFDQFVFNI